MLILLQFFRSHGRCLYAASLILFLQSLYPGGYMPAQLGSGRFLILCPQGLPPGFADDGARHHHHGAHDRNPDAPATDRGTAYCPLGHGLNFKAVAVAVLSITAALPFEFDRDRRPARPGAAPHALGFLPRAPPLS